MAMVTQGPIKEVYFGFNLEQLLVRVDFEQPARQALLPFDTLRIGFEEPAEFELRVEHPSRPTQEVQWHTLGSRKPLPVGTAVGIDRIAEFALPFAALEVEYDAPLQLFVELFEAGQSRDRAPREGNIQLRRPSPDFEQIMWDV
jgi:hypothetical protein